LYTGDHEATIQLKAKNARKGEVQGPKRIALAQKALTKSQEISLV